jgi:hypothetical protein
LLPFPLLGRYHISFGGTTLEVAKVIDLPALNSTRDDIFHETDSIPYIGYVRADNHIERWLPVPGVVHASLNDRNPASLGG